MPSPAKTDQIITVGVALAALFAAAAAVVGAHRNLSLQTEIEYLDRNLTEVSQAYSELRDELQATKHRLVLTREALDALQDGSLDKTLESYIVGAKDRDIRKLQEVLIEKDREIAALRKRLQHFTLPGENVPIISGEEH